MASGDTRTQQYLDIAANGTRADLPSDTCCETRTQTLIRGVAERIMDVEDEVERLENNPDVADIVATYADLQAYPTSQLTDKDVVRVLQDETHDGSSTYYRWSTTTQTWTYIGESKQYSDFVGTDGTTAGTAGLVPAPATTDAGKFLKADGTWDDAGSMYTAGDGIDITNDVVSATNTGKAKVLTTDDYNWPTNNPTGVALWLLEPGIYEVGGNFSVRDTSSSTISSPSASGRGAIAIVGDARTDGGTNTKPIVSFAPNGANAYYAIVNKDTGVKSSRGRLLLSSDVQNVLISTSATDPLSAAQGKALNDKIGGNLSNLTTTDKTSLINAINEVAGQSGGSYTAGDGIDITNDTISATNTGKARELTGADYNYPTGSPTEVALWLLEPGLYKRASASVRVRAYPAGNLVGNDLTFLVGAGNSGKVIFTFGMGSADHSSAPMTGYVVQADGTLVEEAGRVMTASATINNLTSTSQTRPLSAAQGKALKDLIDALDARVAALEGN